MKRIILILLVVVLLMSMLCPFAFARAGGGGGGGSAGIGGRGGFIIRSFERTRNFLSNNFGDRLGIFIYFLFLTVFVLMACVFFSVIFISIQYTRFKSKMVLSRLGKKDPVWNAEKLSKHIKHSFYEIQKAWSDQKLGTVRHLLSDSLYADFAQKLEQNKEQNIVNKLSKIKIKKIHPVSVQDRIGEQNDCVWYYIKARMLDLTYEVSTMQLLSERKKPESFVEYWRFCKKDGYWVLDCIMQQREFKRSFLKSERLQ